MSEASNVVPINKHELQANKIDPKSLSDADVIDMLLAAGTHPSVMNDASRVARRLLEFLPGDNREALGEWQQRSVLLYVDVADLTDEEYDKFAADDIAQKALALIRSKSGHYKGNEQIVEATRSLISLRAGIVLKSPEYEDFRLDKWNAVLKNLGKAAIR